MFSNTRSSRARSELGIVPFGLQRKADQEAESPKTAVIDTDNPITIDMVADRQVKAFFKCGGGVWSKRCPC